MDANVKVNKVNDVRYIIINRGRCMGFERRESYNLHYL